jgi:hypothetical protein
MDIDVLDTLTDGLARRYFIRFLALLKKLVHSLPVVLLVLPPSAGHPRENRLSHYNGRNY